MDEVTIHSVVGIGTKVVMKKKIKKELIIFIFYAFLNLAFFSAKSHNVGDKRCFTPMMHKFFLTFSFLMLKSFLQFLAK